MTKYYIAGVSFGGFSSRSHETENRKKAAKFLSQMKKKFYHVTVNVITDGGTQVVEYIDGATDQIWYYRTLRV